jgi:hypothetical protein
MSEQQQLNLKKIGNDKRSCSNTNWDGNISSICVWIFFHFTIYTIYRERWL